MYTEILTKNLSLWKHSSIRLCFYVDIFIFTLHVDIFIFSYVHWYFDISICTNQPERLKPNTTSHHPAPPSTPQYSLHHKFLVTHPDFTQIYLRLTFWIFFFQNSNWFLQCQRFVKTKCYFLRMSSVGVMNIFLAILVVLESRSFRRNYIDFHSSTFPIDTCIINSFPCIWGVWCIHKNN